MTAMFVLDVRLRHIEPPIWRTVEVPGTINLEDLHFALQAALGWTNSHLHQFEIRNKSYGMTWVDDAPAELLEEREFALSAVAKQGDTLRYDYDFGDGWEHAITVTEVVDIAKARSPRCTAGARACPPEDCGGPPGYDRLLATNPKLRGEKLTLPKKGRDLQQDIMTFKAMMSAEPEPEDDPTALPRELVEAVLDLEPMQRASLAALIAGSLANELLDARTRQR